MRSKLITATTALVLLASGSAYAQSATLTIWSWNVAASALKSTIEGFNKQFPDIKVDVQKLAQAAAEALKPLAAITEAN